MYISDLQKVHQSGFSTKIPTTEEAVEKTMEVIVCLFLGILLFFFVLGKMHFASLKK